MGVLAKNLLIRENRPKLFMSIVLGCVLVRSLRLLFFSKVSLIEEGAFPKTTVIFILKSLVFWLDFLGYFFLSKIKLKGVLFQR